MKLFNTKKRFILTAAIYGCCAFPVFADNTASTTVTVGGDIITALSLTVDETVRFGEVAYDSTNAPEIVINITDQNTGAFTISYTHNGSPDASTSGAGNDGVGTIASTHNRVAVGPGKITVSGEPNYHYIATGGFATVPIPAVTMEIYGLTSSRTLAANGSDSFYLGGKFTTGTGTPLGTYTGTTDITVTYD